MSTTVKIVNTGFVCICSSAPEAPHITSVDYSQGLLYVHWTYGELFIDLSHSRIMHWQVVAVGKKGAERSYSVDVRPIPLVTNSFRTSAASYSLFVVIRQVTRKAMRAGLLLPPGDIYNLTVTAFTERSKNTSTPNIIKLGNTV